MIHAESEKRDSQKSGIMGSISGAYGRYRERAAERKVLAKITKHCGENVAPPDTIIECLHRLNHLWLAGYKYEHEKIGKQVRQCGGMRRLRFELGLPAPKVLRYGEV